MARQLDECGIYYAAQGSSVKEINEALKSASKRGTGNVEYPEYTAVIGDFVLVVEDKADIGKHIRLTVSVIIDLSNDLTTFMLTVHVKPSFLGQVTSHSTVPALIRT